MFKLTAMQDPFLPTYDFNDIPTDEEVAAERLAAGVSFGTIIKIDTDTGAINISQVPVITGASIVNGSINIKGEV